MLKAAIFIISGLIHVSSAAVLSKGNAVEWTSIEPDIVDPPCIPMKDSSIFLCAGDYITFHADHGKDKIYADMGGCFNNNANYCQYQVRGAKNPSDLNDTMKFQIFPIARNMDPPPQTSPIFYSPDNSWLVYLRDYRGLWLQTAPETAKMDKKSKYQFDFLSAYKFQSRQYPVVETFVLVKPDYPMNVFYLLRPKDGALFWQFGSDKEGSLFLFDRPYMPTMDKINLALVQIDRVDPPAGGLNYKETFTDYFLNVTSGYREVKPLDVIMSGYAENLSPQDQSVSISWSRSVTAGQDWFIQHQQSITVGLSMTLGVPTWLMGGSNVGVNGNRQRQYQWKEGGSASNSTVLNVQTHIKVPAYSTMQGRVAAQKGVLEGVQFTIKYNRDFLNNPKFSVSYVLNGTWSVSSYLDVRVCWSPVQSIFDDAPHTNATCALPGVGPTIDPWIAVPDFRLLGNETDGADSELAVDRTDDSESIKLMDYNESSVPIALDNTETIGESDVDSWASLWQDFVNQLSEAMKDDQNSEDATEQTEDVTLE